MKSQRSCSRRDGCIGTKSRVLTCYAISLMHQTVTHSELLFQQYLDSRKVTWEREPSLPGKMRHPDYLVHLEERLCWFEVKEFDEPEAKPKGSFTVCPSITEKIARARKQFREYKGDCCAVVLHNCASVYRSTRLDAVLSAAFGEYIELGQGARAPLIEEAPRFKFYGNSLLSPRQNTTISAIVILEHYELQERLVEAWQDLRARQGRGDTLGPLAFSEILDERERMGCSRSVSYAGTVRVRVIINPFARHPFPVNCFSGPFDQHWGIEKVSGWFSLQWIGNESKRLQDTPCNVPFWLL
jgi:hypothetical protein